MTFQTEVKTTSTPALVSMSIQNGLLQRKCSRCGTHSIDGESDVNQKKQLKLQRRATNEAAALPAVPPIVHDVLRSPGEPLDHETRAFMEPHFGHDFSKVRVHADAEAAESARAVKAYAYTAGQDLVFGAGKYAPGTNAGKMLLAHELTHVVQQEAGEKGMQARLELMQPDGSAEREAKMASRAVMRGENLTSISPHPMQIAREIPDAGVPDAGMPDNNRVRQVECVKRQGGCPNTRPAGIPSPEEITQYNQRCRGETGYTGGDVTPTSEECASPQPLRGICGPNITASLAGAVSNTRSMFAGWTPTQKQDACSALVSLRTGGYAWDIVELHNNAWILNFRPQCATQGAEPRCGSTVQVGSDCHYAGSANYVIFGVMCKLCYDHFISSGSLLEALKFTESEMLGWVNFYKGWSIFTIFTQLGPSSNFEASKSWASAGYRGWPGAAAPAGDRSNCLPRCPRPYTGTFLVHWVPHMVIEGR
ncbi:Uncharacterised protein [uncultured archaeon]|nr:Uncharacterised protein [uncultured archaeon]